MTVMTQLETLARTVYELDAEVVSLRAQRLPFVTALESRDSAQIAYEGQVLIRTDAFITPVPVV